jgi:hypothetical protein
LWYFLFPINEASGTASEIELVAVATAKGIMEIAKSINSEGGMNADNLRIAEQYLTGFGKLAKVNNTVILCRLIFLILLVSMRV